MGCTPLNPAGFCFSGTWEGNTDSITLGGRPWEPPRAGWQPIHPLPRGVLEGFPSSRAFWCGCPAPIFKPVALKTEKKNQNPQTKQTALPIDIPLTAVLAAWLGYEWTHSFSPRLLCALPPASTTPKLPTPGAEIPQSQHGRTPSSSQLRAERLLLLLPTPAAPSLLEAPSSGTSLQQTGVPSPSARCHLQKTSFAQLELPRRFN